MPTVGLRLEAVLDFAARVTEGMATRDVKEVIKTMTKEWRGSYAKSLVGETDGAGEPLLGRATTFVSHAWSYDFGDTVAALVEFEKGRPGKGRVFYWFDIFVLNYHYIDDADQAKPDGFFDEVFKSTIGAVQETVQVVTPWNDPLTLTRAWCIFELYSTMNADKDILFALPPKDRDRFKETLRSDFHAVMNSLVTIDAENAEAMKASDKESIFAQIRRMRGGFPALNNRIMVILRAWHADTGRKVVEAALDSADTGGEEALEALRLGHQLGVLYQGQGRTDEAEAMYLKVVAGLTKALGESHSTTLHFVRCLAIFYDEQGH